MWDDLIDGDPTGQVLSSCIAKEEQQALLATPPPSGRRYEVAHRPHGFNSFFARTL